MTTVILNAVFLLAFSRAFSVPLSQLLGILTPLMLSDFEASILNLSSFKGVAQEGVGASNKTHKLEPAGVREVAAIIDTFNAAYAAAYRSVHSLQDSQ